MSFDTLFDYTKPKSFLNGKISMYNDNLENINEELSILGNLSNTYQSMSVNRSTLLQNRKICYENTLSKLSNILSEIIVVESLPSDSKNVLYDFYSTHIKPKKLEPKPYYMMRMMYNTGNLVTHTEHLLTDGNISSSEANCIVGLIRECCPIHRQSACVQHSLITLEDLDIDDSP